MSIITFKTHICNCIAEFKNKSCFVLSKNVFAITNIGITWTIATKQSTVDFGPWRVQWRTHWTDWTSVSLSHTEHGWAHGSNTVYSVIHGLTGTSIELQPCLGMSWYDLDSNVARVCTNKTRIYSVKQGLSRFVTVWIRFSYDCCTVPSTV